MIDVSPDAEYWNLLAGRIADFRRRIDVSAPNDEAAMRGEAADLIHGLSNRIELAFKRRRGRCASVAAPADDMMVDLAGGEPAVASSTAATTPILVGGLTDRSEPVLRLLSAGPSSSGAIQLHS